MGAQETPGSVVKLSKKGIDFFENLVYNNNVIKRDKSSPLKTQQMFFTKIFQKSFKKDLTNQIDYDII